MVVMDLLFHLFHTTDTTMIIMGLMAVGFGLYMAWTIGANDVANAMATSVGSGTVSFKQAVLIAAIFELTGAVLAGGTVTDTVRKGIVNTNLFMQNPNLLILGMVAALLAAAIWLHAATYFGMPVSTTHSIVGAIVGFGVLLYGATAVHWQTVFFIVLSWIISPIGGGLLSFLVFVLIRRAVLTKPNPSAAIKIWAPIFGALTVWIIVISAIWKGLARFKLHPSSGEMVIISLIAAATGYVFLTILVRRRAKKLQDASQVESIFMILQLFTACYVAFAHGSNDIANAVGPMAAVIQTISKGIVALKVEVPFWILLMGGVGIVFGLAIYGARVMRTVGKNITEITPSRGFSAEFSAASVVLVASKLGLPISTTHTLVGAVLGVGLAQGFDALNLRVIRTIIWSWLLTLPIAAGLTMVIFSIFRVIFAV
jgi:PiT family inorganic phosphate transporter